MSTKPQKPQKTPQWTAQRVAALTLTAAWQLGARSLNRIRERFPDLAAFIRTPNAWRTIPLQEAQRAALARVSHQKIQEIIQTLAAQHIQFVLPQEATFPQRLTRMEDPPFALFIRGAPVQPDVIHIAMVGTRRITREGTRATTFLAGELAHAGITVVSGFALGADIAAHTGCVNAGGRTIGVLPSGIDDASIAPRAHLRFAHNILAKQCGTLLSEYPPGTPIRKFQFLVRNRLVAALAHAVVITEGDHDSGALVTARLALENGQEVLAVPGSIFLPTARGTNQLIADGARPCRNLQDILAVLGMESAQHAAQINTARSTIPMSPAETALLQALQTPHTIDELSRALKIPASDISATMSLLELKGRIISVGPRTYIQNTI